MAQRRVLSPDHDVRFTSPVSMAYCQVIRSIPSLIFALLHFVLIWPRIQMVSEFLRIADAAAHWFGKLFVYSLTTWCILGIVVLLFWVLMMFIPRTVIMKTIRILVFLRTAAWYCVFPGAFVLYIKVTSVTCYLNMHIFLVTLIGGLVLLLLAGVYAFRLFSLCKITADMDETLSTGTPPHAFGYSINMVATNIALAAAALFAADYMSDYAFLPMFFQAPHVDMLLALKSWAEIQSTVFEVCIFEYYFDIPWISLISAAVNLPMLLLYWKYMKASQISPKTTEVISDAE